jgi:hypothetical protein
MDAVNRNPNGVQCAFGCGNVYLRLLENLITEYPIPFGVD